MGGREGDCEAPIKHQTDKILGDGLSYLGIGRDAEGKISHSANYYYCQEFFNNSQGCLHIDHKT